MTSQVAARPRHLRTPADRDGIPPDGRSGNPARGRSHRTDRGGTHRHGVDRQQPCERGRAAHRLAVAGVGGRCIVFPQNPVLLSEHSEPQPDLALLKPREDYYRSALPGAGFTFALNCDTVSVPPSESRLKPLCSGSKRVAS